LSGHRPGSTIVARVGTEKQIAEPFHTLTVTNSDQEIVEPLPVGVVAHVPRRTRNPSGCGDQVVLGITFAQPGTDSGEAFRVDLDP